MSSSEGISSRALDLEKRICAGGVEQANEVSKLLALFTEIAIDTVRDDSDSDNDAEDNDTVGKPKESISVLHSVRRVFSFLLERGDLFSGKHNSVSNAALEKYSKWVEARYLEFILHLLQWLDCPSPIFQVASFRTLMHFVKIDGCRYGENISKFGKQIYLLVISSIVKGDSSAGLNGQVLRVFHEEFLDSYVDCSAYALECISTICEAAQTKNAKKSKKNTLRITLDTLGRDQVAELLWKQEDRAAVVENLFNLLYLVPSPNSEEIKSWWVDPTSPKAIPNVLDIEVLLKNKITKQYKKLFQDAWVQFLAVKGRPIPVYRKILLCFPTKVVPNFINPLLLSDFLLDAYEIGGLTSIMALQSLFQLIVEHNLDCPDFYEKLYALLTLETFHAKHRAEFFSLLDKVLSSSHLATYLVAAYAKRILRLALLAPPASQMFAVVLVSNLLKKHPTCLALVHESHEAAELRKSKQQNKYLSVKSGAGQLEDDETSEMINEEEDINKEKREKLDRIKHASIALALGLGKKRKRPEDGMDEEEEDTKKQNVGVSEPSLHLDPSTGSFPSDPFNFASDPSECNALESYLWEIDALGKHFSPNVSLLVRALYYKEMKTTIETKKVQPPLPIDDFLTLSYKGLFDREIKKGLRKRKKNDKIALSFTNPFGDGEPKSGSVFSLF